MKSMGGVTVIHPQDSINNNHPDILLVKSRRTIRFNHTHTNPPSHTPNYSAPPKGILKKKNRNNKEAVSAEQLASKNLVIGQVNLLKRGENLNQSTPTTEFFAGFAFVDSPPPSSVPLPGFFTKNFGSADPRNDPTTELRRILGLSLS